MTNSAPLSAIPPVWARVVGVGVIIGGGFLGGILGYLIARVLCTGECGFQLGIGVLIGSTLAALGMAVVTVLALRAMGEWRYQT